MFLFLFRRAVLALLVCLTALVISFALTRLSGDIAISIAGPNATGADIEIIRRNYGFDRPLPVQFLDWAWRAARGDLGKSYIFHVQVAELVRERLPVTLTLGLTGLSIALLVGIPLGIVAAMYFARHEGVREIIVVDEMEIPAVSISPLVEYMEQPAIHAKSDIEQEERSRSVSSLSRPVEKQVRQAQKTDL